MLEALLLTHLVRPMFLACELDCRGSFTYEHLLEIVVTCDKKHG